MIQCYHRVTTIAQPIVSQKTHEIYAMEILSRSSRVLEVESLFNTMPTHESMLFTCSQFELVDEAPDGVKININAAHESIFDIYFLDALEKVNTEKVALEIDYFYPKTSVIDDFIKIVNHIKALGCEVWLDDYRVDHGSSMLLSIPWTGVKIDKKLVWREMKSNQALEAIIMNCKRNGFLVTLEGVENKCIYDLVKNTSADFLQGYYWPEERYG